MRRARSIASVGALLAALVVSSCAKDEKFFEVRELPCAPADEVDCVCDNGGRGRAICAGDGSGFLACSNCKLSCTLYPDCEGCTTCFETCMCYDSAEHPTECQDTCERQSSLGGGSGGGSGSGGSSSSGGSSGSGGGQCVEASCPEPGFPQVGAKCCTGGGDCGFRVDMLGPDCIQGDQPGQADPACSDRQLMGITLQGCCRPDGKCGYLDTYVGFGCADPGAFGMPSTETCTP